MKTANNKTLFLLATAIGMVGFALTGLSLQAAAALIINLIS